MYCYRYEVKWIDIYKDYDEAHNKGLTFAPNMTAAITQVEACYPNSYKITLTEVDETNCVDAEDFEEFMNRE